MGYTIKTLNDRLSDHVFEINGAIALKNYTAQVHGNRIKITSTENAALSILEADVSEVEIDGVVYNNAQDAQNALKSIVYADLPIVVLTEKEKQNLIFKAGKRDPEATHILNRSGQSLNPTTADENNLAEDDAFIIALDTDGNPYKMPYNNWFGKGSGLGTEDQTIESGVVREIDVQGELKIKNLEEKENDDTEFSKKMVLTEDGTLATKADTPSLNVIFPTKIAVQHNYMTIQTQEETWQEDILEQIINVETGNYTDYYLTGKTETGTIQNIEPTASRVTANGVVCQYKYGFRDVDSRDEKAWLFIDLPTRGDFIIQADCIKNGDLFSEASIGVVSGSTPILTAEGEGNGFIAPNNNGSQYIHSVGGRYKFYIMKTADLITIMIVSKTRQKAGVIVAEAENMNNLKLKLSIIDKRDYLELINFKIKNI